MNMKNQLMLSVLLAGAVAGLHAADKPKHTIKEVMNALHKGDTALAKKVMGDKGTPEDFNKLVEYYSALPLQTPPTGDARSWDKRTTALVAAAKGLQAGKRGALGDYQDAVNCKACHSLHKPE